MNPPPDSDLPDLAAMCCQAGVPADDAGVQRLVQLVVLHCAGICETFEPEGDADLVPRHHAREVGAQLGVKLRAYFGVG